MATARKQYSSLDLAKFICAILIIILHTAPLSSYSRLLTMGLRSIITVVAVPFFFITSGFLLFQKLNTLDAAEQKAYFIRYEKRLILMYLLWSVVYFPFVVTGWVQNGCTAMDVLQYVKRIFFEGSFSTIWFLPALIAASAFVYVLHKRLSAKTVVCLAVPFYLFACLGSSYYGLVEKVTALRVLFDAYFSFFDSIKNGLLFGFLFVALGAYFAEWEQKPKMKQMVIFSAGFFVLMAGETVAQAYLRWSSNGVDTKLFLAPLAGCLFVAALQMKLPEGHERLWQWMRKMSLMMFLSQRIFLTLFERHLADTLLVQNSMLYFVSILVLTMAFSAVFIKLAEKVKFLRYFC